MNVSVIIPTYNGANKILNVLRAVEQQTYTDLEVIVVIDGSTDNTVDILRNHTFKFHPIIIDQQNSGRSGVRNSGAKNAKGNLLIFFDDDMRPREDCVAVHVQHHQNYPSSLLTGSQIDDYKNATNDFLKYKCWLTRKWSEHFIETKGHPLTKNNLHITAANFSINKNLFFELGGFDDRLNDAEDFDLAVRALNKNLPIYYNHNAFGWHDDVVTLQSYIKRKREYLRSHQLLKKIKPQAYSAVTIRDPEQIKGMKRLIFSFFAFPFWIRWLEKGRLSFLPTQVRYKIYDWVTTAYGSVFINRKIG